MSDIVERLQNWDHGNPKTMIVSEAISEIKRLRAATDRPCGGNMERVPLEKLAKHFRVSLADAEAAQADLGFLYREVAL